MDQVKNSDEGFLILIECLNLLIDNSGKRQKLINDSKEKVMQTYADAQSYLPVETIRKQLQVNSQKIFRLQVSGKCKASTFKHCMKLCPNQLSLSEQTLIRRYLSDSAYENLPINHLWADARRHGLYISITTFYKYVRQIKGKKEVPMKEERKQMKVTTTKPFEILHMDSTTFRCTNGERVYIHFIMDNFSRTVLGAVPSYSSKSEVVSTNLKDVLLKFNLFNTQFELYCDDGPENHGDVTELLSKRPTVTKIVANYSTSRSNNMIEAWNKKFKRIILTKFKAKSFDNLAIDLPKMVEYFNNLPLPVLGTLTPHEVIIGTKSEDLELKNKMSTARAERVIQNRALNCDIKSSIATGNFACYTNL